MFIRTILKCRVSLYELKLLLTQYQLWPRYHNFLYTTNNRRFHLLYNNLRLIV